MYALPHTKDMLRMAYELAYFIHSDKKDAISIVTAALAKQEVAVAAQDKRLYYRPTGRPLSATSREHASRTKVSLSEPHLLQRLIYIESEPYERQAELRGRSSGLDEESMVVHFTKHLVRLIIKRNSFYTALGLCRLLYSYSTPETMEIYNVVVQDPDRVKDDYYYRSRKGRLMQEMKERFGGLVTTFRGQRGEEKFRAHQEPARFCGLVKDCLSLFTPWFTSCLVHEGFDPVSQELSGLTFKGGPPDDEHRVEVNRIHTLLHPDCYGRLIRSLRFDPPEHRLQIPQFNFAADSAGGPGGDRRQAPELSEEEIMAIAGQLADQAARRKTTVGSWLRVLVDGCERARLDPRQASSARVEVDEGAEVIEVHGQHRGEDVLLAVYVLPSNEEGGAVAASQSFITLEGGQTITFSLSPLADDERQASGAVVAVKYREAGLVQAVLLGLRQWARNHSAQRTGVAARL
jgi:hypothetical protein